MIASSSSWRSRLSESASASFDHAGFCCGDMAGGEAGNCDNDVHEIFKALEEAALTSAYLIEREDGSLSTYNCTAKKVFGTINITLAEDVISRVHLNLKKKHKVKVEFASGDTVSGYYSGMQWVGPGGIPEDLR